MSRKHSPVLSVVVPVFNVRNYLVQSLETIIAQTLKDIEIILIDDGSTDGSLQILRKYEKKDNRIHVYTQKNKGPGYTRNKGISLTRGEYICFLDADDFFELDMLECMYNRAKDRKADIVFSDFYIFDEMKQEDQPSSREVNAIREKYMPKTSTFSSLDCVEYLYQIDTSAVWNKIYRRKFIIDNNIHFAELTRAEDVLFTLGALTLAKSITYLDKPFVHYRFKDKTNKHPQEVIWAHDQLLNFLYTKKVYPFYRKTYLKQFITSVLYFELEDCPFPERHFASDLFYSRIKKFGIQNTEEGDILEGHWYNCFNDFLDLYIPAFKLRKLYSSSSDRIVPIVFATDDNYTAITGVAIQSIIMHANPSWFYDIYILYSEEISKLKVFRILNSNNIRITVVNVNKITKSKEFPLDENLRHITKETYYRLFIPELFSYKKVIYLDGDLITQVDLIKLYNINLGDALLAGVPDMLTEKEELEREKWGWKISKYVNAGVLVFNNYLWKKENIVEKCWEEVEHPSYSYTLNDQDIINFVCKNRILTLNCKWNFLYAAYRSNPQRYRFICQRNLIPQKFSILHYNGGWKVWKYSSKNIFGPVWWNYARLSLFYESFFLHIPSKETTQKTVEISQVKLSDEELYKIMKLYIKESFKYLFSIGERRRQYRLRLKLISSKIFSNK